MTVTPSVEPGVATQPKAKVAAILLAAGGSRRLGRPKQLLNWQGQPLVRHVARWLLASTAYPIFVVLGHRADAVADSLDGLDVRLVANPGWQGGQSSSIHQGLAAITTANLDIKGAAFVPCDQPLLTASTLDALIDHFIGDATRIVRPRYAGSPGAPVIFPKSLFPQLSQLTGDEGGRALLRKLPERQNELAIEDAAQGRDIDTVEDAASFGLRLASDG